MNKERLIKLRDALIKQHKEAPKTYDQDAIDSTNKTFGCAMTTSDHIFPYVECRTDFYDLLLKQFTFIFGTSEEIEETAAEEHWPISGTWTAQDAADRIQFLIDEFNSEWKTHE